MLLVSLVFVVYFGYFAYKLLMSNKKDVAAEARSLSQNLARYEYLLAWAFWALTFLAALEIVYLIATASLLHTWYLWAYALLSAANGVRGAYKMHRDIKTKEYLKIKEAKDIKHSVWDIFALTDYAYALFVAGLAVTGHLG